MCLFAGANVLGVKYEIFSCSSNASKNVTIYGDGYLDNFKGMKDKEKTNCYPFYSLIEEYFLKEGSRLQEDKNNKLPPELILESTRNNILFRYSVAYHNKDLIYNLNLWALETPLGEDEIESLTREDVGKYQKDGGEKRESTSEEHIGTAEEQMGKKVSVPADPAYDKDPTFLEENFNQVKLSTEGLTPPAKALMTFIKYFSLNQNCIYLDQFYFIDPSSDILWERILWERDNGSRINQMIKHYFLNAETDKKLVSYALSNVKELTGKLSSYLKVSGNHENNKVGFTNVALDIEKRTVHKHEKSNYITNLFTVPLQENTVRLSADFRQVISALCGYSSERINLLRLAFRHLIFPSYNIQQIVFLYGGVQTGKSTICEYMRFLHGDDCGSASCGVLNKPFEAASFVNYKVLILADIEYFLNKEELKKYAGRDRIHTEVKFEQSSDSIPFIPSL